MESAAPYLSERISWEPGSRYEPHDTYRDQAEKLPLDANSVTISNTKLS